MNRSEIKEKAKGLLKGNLWELFKPVLLVMVISVVVQAIPNILGISTTTKTTTEILGQMVEVESTNLIGNIWSIISSTISLILSFGLVNYVLKFVRGQKTVIEDVFNTIKEHFVLVLIVSLIVSVLTTIGTILLIIPGIIISLGLAFCNYIIVDNSDMQPMDVIKKSWEMMKGHKVEYLVYILSFLGWLLTCVLIAPIYYVVPYMNVTFALYYEELKKQAK